jgi:hypothetical protein
MSESLFSLLNKIQTPWGPLGYVVYKRTYSRRFKEDDVNSPTEEYIHTVERVVKGCNKQLKVGFTEAEEIELATILLKLPCVFPIWV